MTEQSTRGRHVLTSRQTFLAASWLKDADITGCRTFADLAARISAAVGFSITEGNARGLMDTVERELPTPPRSLESRVAALEAEVRQLKERS